MYMYNITTKLVETTLDLSVLQRNIHVTYKFRNCIILYTQTVKSQGYIMATGEPNCTYFINKLHCTAPKKKTNKKTKTNNNQKKIVII